MAKEIFGPVGSPRYLDYAETIHRSGRKLLQMVSQILDFTESEAGTLQLTESSTNLAMTVRSVVEFVRADTTARDMKIEEHYAPDLPRIRADQDAIRQKIGRAACRERVGQYV